eukprot:jgi/Tetstr1/461448/TSEL_006557.t1
MASAMLSSAAVPVGMGRTGVRAPAAARPAAVRVSASRQSAIRPAAPARPLLARVVPNRKPAQRGSLRVEASSTPTVAVSASPDPPAEPFKWGAKMKPLLTCVAIGVVLWFIPAPEGVTTKAWHLLAIFVATIAGIITSPLPLGAVAMLGLGAAMLTKTMTFAAAFSAFASEIPWLIAIAFWLSGAFIKSGLGSRVAYTIVSLFGKTTLGLTYSLVFAEALLSPAIPSVAARAGGIFFPLAKALCVACGSSPEDGTQKKMGAYLMKTCFQSSTISSAMFITAMAANPLAVNLAAAAGVNITWGGWALAAIVPGLCCLIGMPLILYALFPPEVKDTPDAPIKARQELDKLGPLSLDEKITGGAFAITVSLWICGASIGVNAVAAALVGLTILLVTGVTTWKECLSNNQAWDTLTWFAALIAMAAYLNKEGFIPWFSGQVVNLVGGLGLAWQPAFLIIVLLYYYSHYLFASGAAHIGAMYTAFLSVAISCGAPAMAAALCLAQLSNLMGCLTFYGIGSGPPFYNAGYVAQADWYKLGFICSVFYLSVWLGVGSIWWKAIGIL